MCLAMCGLNGHPQAWTPLCWSPALEAATHSLLILLGGSLKAEGFGDGFSWLNTYLFGGSLAVAGKPALSLPKGRRYLKKPKLTDSYCHPCGSRGPELYRHNGFPLARE